MPYVRACFHLLQCVVTPSFHLVVRPLTFLPFSQGVLTPRVKHSSPFLILKGRFFLALGGVSNFLGGSDACEWRPHLPWCLAACSGRCGPLMVTAWPGLASLLCVSYSGTSPPVQDRVLASAPSISKPSLGIPFDPSCIQFATPSLRQCSFTMSTRTLKCSLSSYEPWHIRSFDEPLLLENLHPLCIHDKLIFGRVAYHYSIHTVNPIGRHCKIL